MLKDLIEYQDFEKLDIRVGKVIASDLPEWSTKLVRYVMDFGPEIGQRTLFSGIRVWYKPEDLIDKKYPVIINMAPKKMGDEESQGMMIMAACGSDKPFLIELPDEIELGSVVR